MKPAALIIALLSLSLGLLVLVVWLAIDARSKDIEKDRAVYDRLFPNLIQQQKDDLRWAGKRAFIQINVDDHMPPKSN